MDCYCKEGTMNWVKNELDFAEDHVVVHLVGQCSECGVVAKAMAVGEIELQQTGPLVQLTCKGTGEVFTGSAKGILSYYLEDKVMDIDLCGPLEIKLFRKGGEEDE